MAFVNRFVREKVSEINGKPIVMYRNHNEGKPEVFISGWTHHYEHTDRVLRPLIRGEMDISELDFYSHLFDEFDMHVIADMNPSNYAALNRTFEHYDLPEEYRFLEELDPMLAVDLHGDVDSRRFYLYERRAEDLPPIGKIVLKRLKRSGFGVDARTQPLEDDENTLEEYFSKKGAAYSITTEGPYHKSTRKVYNLVNTMALFYILEGFYRVHRRGLLVARPVVRRKKTETIPLNPERVTVHEVRLPSSMRLSLDEWFRGSKEAVATVSIPQFSSRSYAFKTWQSREEAEREFPQILERFRRGEYALHIYHNGNVRIEVE